MAFITENDIFSAGIYLIASSDPVQGGLQTSIDNEPHRALADRTRYLYNRLNNAGVGASKVYSGNLNALTGTGFYFVDSSATNKPSGVTTGFCTVVNDSTTATLVQTLIDAATNTVWFRRITSGPTYNSWVKLRTEDTATGTPVGFEAGWSEVSGYPISVYRDGKICVSQGRMEGGTAGVNGTSFGPGYAPSQTLIFVVNGGVVFLAASTGNVMFSGVAPVDGVDLNFTWRIP